ncbi:MAG: KdsC family phosphatase [Wenzhouxiangella sp.]
MSRLDETELRQRAAGIRLAVFDVDGVLTDGTLFLDDAGRQFKAFNVRDGLGLKALMRHDIEVAVITARRSGVVEKRMAELGIRHLQQGVGDKHAVLLQLQADLQIAPAATSFMGDDLIDFRAMQASGLSAAPADADAWIRSRVDLVTQAGGGRGAVREFSELLLAARGALTSWQNSYR